MNFKVVGPVISLQIWKEKLMICQKTESFLVDVVKMWMNVSTGGSEAVQLEPIEIDGRWRLHRPVVIDVFRCPANGRHETFFPCSQREMKYVLK